MTPALLGCIADDFTGATDLANNLVRSGLRTVQCNGVPDPQEPIPEADAIVVALKSRTIEPAHAVAQSLQAWRWLQRAGVEQVYLKYCSTFDSTPRGNIGPVTDALLDELEGPDAGFTVACPAFPENGRTVYRGHLFVGDVLLSDSGMRHHPLTPMTDANLVRVMQAQTRRRVGLVRSDDVARGSEAIRARFAALRAQGIGVAIVDAVDDADLHRIGAALAGMPLVTGGSGIAIGLAQNWRRRGLLADAGRPDALPAVTGPRAIVSGSCSAATNAQVRHFREGGGAALAIDPLALAGGRDLVAEALAWALPRLRERPDQPVLIHATAEPDQVQAVQARLGAAQAGELVERALAAIATGLVRDGGVRRLLVAGGETSGAVVQALGVRQMVIGPQIDPGVPWTAVRSPLLPDSVMHMALKSGNFGSIDIFDRAWDRARADTSPGSA